MPPPPCSPGFASSHPSDFSDPDRAVRACARAIDDPSRSAYPLVYTPKAQTSVVGTFGYSWKAHAWPVQAQLVINNLLNQRSVTYVGTALRPRNGDYTSLARDGSFVRWQFGAFVGARAADCALARTHRARPRRWNATPLFSDTPGRDEDPVFTSS